MKLPIISKNLEKQGEIDLPKQFNEKLRKDIIKKAVEAEQSQNRQTYGAAPRAGKRHSSFLSKRRHKYRSTYGIGQSRTPRKILSRRGTRINYVGATAPMTVGGRRAHPPKAEKKWAKKINLRERNLAMRCAISATISKPLAEQRGHILPQEYPFVVDDSILVINKTKDVINFLASLGLKEELERAQVKKVRPGKGKGRTRKYKKKKTALIVVDSDCDLIKSASNIPGIDIVKVDELSTETLAPGTVPGRLTLWTKKAVEKLTKDNLYM